MCLQDVFMLSVSLGLWAQKNFVNRDETTAKMEKQGNKEEETNTDKYGFITQKSPENTKKGPFSALNIVIFLSMLFLAFYCIAIFWTFKAYKEFKGAVEDSMGGPAALRKQDMQ